MKPRLINPVKVTIQRLNQSGTTWDPVFRETVANTAVAYLAPEEITAQATFQSFDQRQMVPAGDTPNTLAHILYERSNTASLKKGDKITAFGGIALQNPVFVNSVEPAVQYGGIFYMERALLQERAKGL